MIYIEETQYFRQKWLWAIISFFPLFSAYSIYEQIIMGNPVGSNPVDNVVIWCFSIFAGVGFPIFFYFMKLKMKVTKEGLYYQFYPIHLKEHLICFDEITSFKERKYSPINEFGGWGIRYGFQGKAYNVSGNKGIQLILKNGNKILFGSQKSRELENALKKASRN